MKQAQRRSSTLEPPPRQSPTAATDDHHQSTTAVRGGERAGGVHNDVKYRRRSDAWCGNAVELRPADSPLAGGLVFEVAHARLRSPPRRSSIASSSAPEKSQHRLQFRRGSDW
uniref:Uncharacterized protein n=1 Tax=Oryza glumipatula TaxID=40148 RepID=A0A0E0A829_9ORYZ